MSIFSSMYIGMSGMKVNEHAIGIVGDNIANMNTIGFKASRGQFEDLLNQTILGSAGASQVGQGATLAGVERLHLQGALLGTGVSTDLAIGGNGFFIVNGSTAGTTGNFYTRNGQFHMDKDGYLVNAHGFKLQGYLANQDSQLSPILTDLQVGNATLSPKSTEGIAMALNLDAETDIAANPFDPANPADSAGFSTAITVYDSLGKGHQLDVYFVKTAEGQWEWHALAEGGELDGGVAGTATEVASGTITFTTDGLLDTEAQAASNVTFVGASSQDLIFDFGEALTTDGGDGTGTSGFGSPSTVNFQKQDGYGAGSFQYMTIDAKGEIIGTFSNGEIRTLGQVALATFPSQTGLKSIGQNLFLATRASGEPTVGGPGTGGRGDLYAGSLEQSNVDLTNEFTQLIVSERGYQANSRIISTADQLLAEVIALKR